MNGRSQQVDVFECANCTTVILPGQKLRGDGRELQVAPSSIPREFACAPELKFNQIIILILFCNVHKT